MLQYHQREVSASSIGSKSLVLPSLVLTWFFASIGFCDEIQWHRIEKLPSPSREAWIVFWERSLSIAKADADTLAAEVLTNGMVTAQKAPNGGWSKHLGFTSGRRRPGTQWTSQSEPGKSPHYLSTFDNRSTTEQISFLAEVWRATGNQNCANGVVRGVEFLLASQYPNGGWPQVYPLEGGYHDNITLNDDAMTHILEVCNEIALDTPAYKCLSGDLRERVRASLQRGIECILAMQIRIDGRPSGWCAQHDPLTLEPTAARKMEPAALASVESARMVKFLMSLENQTSQQKEAIEGCLQWLDQAKITNVRKIKIDGKTSYDLDPASTEIYWARFYDLRTRQAIFPGRDGIVYDSFHAMSQSNALGYDFYSAIPESIVTTAQKKWRKRVMSSK